MAKDNLAIKILINAVDNASKAFRQVEETVSSVTRTIGQMAAAVASYFAIDSIGNFFGSLVSSAANLEKEFSTLQAVTGATTEDLARLQAKAEELGASDALSVSAVEAAQAMTELARAGQSTEQILASITPVMALAQAASLDLGTAANIVTANLAGFQLSADQSGRVADVLAVAASSAKTTVSDLASALSYAAPAANAAGMSLEETTAIIAMLQNAGIDASRAGTALNAVLSQLSNPASTASKALQEAGISSRDFADVLAGLETTSASTEAAINAFGTEAGPALRALIAQGVESIKDLQTSLENASGSAEQTAATMNDNLLGAFDALSSVWDSVTTALGKPLLEPLTAQVRALAAALDEFAHSPTFAAIQNGLVNAFNAAASAAATLGRNIGSIALVAAAAGFSALASAVTKTTAAMAAYVKAQMAVAQATAASTAANQANAASMTLAARAANGLKGALALLLSPLVMVSGTVVALIGYKLGEWLRESAEEARGTASAFGALDAALQTLDRGLQSLSDSYRGQIEAEQELAEKRRQGAEILSQVAQQTGIAFDSLQSLGDAVERGVVVFDRANDAWYRGAVSMDTAANAATNLDAALQAQAQVIAEVAERESAAEAIARARREASIELANAYGNEGEALRLTAEAREADLAQSQRLVEIRAAELANAQARLDAMIAEAEASKDGIGVKQAEIGALTNLVEIKSKALAEAQMSVEAAQNEADAARLAADTYGDQSARVDELLQKREALTAQLRELAAVQEAGIEAQNRLAEAEERVRAATEAYSAALEQGSADTADLAVALAEAEAEVRALHEAIDAGNAAAQREIELRRQQAETTARLTDALDDLIKKRQRELDLAERNTDAVQAESDARVTHLRNLAEEAELRGDVERAAQLNEKADRAEIAGIRELIKSHESELRVKEQLLVALQQEANADKEVSDAERQKIADTQESIEKTKEEIATLQEEARHLAAVSTVKKQAAASASDMSKSADKAAKSNKKLGDSTKKAGDLAAWMTRQLGYAINELRKYSDAAADAVQNIMASVDGWGNKVERINDLAKDITFFDTSSVAEAKRELAELGEAAERTAAQIAALEKGQNDAFNYLAGFEAAILAIKRVQLAAIEAQQAQLRMKIATEELDNALSNLQRRLDDGAISTSDFIREAERLEYQFYQLNDEDLEGLRDAIADARREMEGFTQSAEDGLVALQIEWARLNDQQEEVLRLEYERDRLEIENQIAEAKKQENAEAISALEQQLHLLDMIYQKKQEDLRAEQESLRIEKEQSEEMARYADVVNNLNDEFDDLKNQLNDGAISTSNFVHQAEKLESKFQELNDEDLEGLRDAIADARREMEDFTQSAEDGLAALQIEWARLNDQQEEVLRLEYERDRLEIETQLAQAKADNNVEAIRALEQQLALLKKIYDKKQEDLRLEREQTAEKERQAELEREAAELEREAADNDNTCSSTSRSSSSTSQSSSSTSRSSSASGSTASSTVEPVRTVNVNITVPSGQSGTVRVVEGDEDTLEALLRSLEAGQAVS